jgi:hypothetical protein
LKRVNQRNNKAIAIQDQQKNFSTKKDQQGFCLVNEGTELMAFIYKKKTNKATQILLEASN